MSSQISSYNYEGRDLNTNKLLSVGMVHIAELADIK